jgi:RNA polymerase sigma factor (sigma-70 family)
MFMDDNQLLLSYAVHRSEEAFRELVRRHVAIVHGVARRQVGIDAHLADDVTQRVFIALARKADSLRDQPTLVGWLYTAARLEAARTVRSEGRRRNWEGKAANMNQSQTPEASPEVSWDQFRPVLDDAMSQLAEADRNAVLLRFFSGRSFTDVGHVFQISEDAARKRVDRAVEKLRQILGRRGIVSTSSALCTALGAHAAPALSEEALATIVAAAWPQASSGAALSFGIYMSSTKVTVAVASAVLLLAGASVIRDASRVGLAATSQAVAESELAALVQQRETVRSELSAIRRQKADADAREREIISTAANPLRPYLQDPEYRALARKASQARRHLEFQRLYRQLQLSPDQIEQFEQIMARQAQATLDGQVARDIGRDEQAIYRQSGPEWSSAMKNLLGADGMHQLQDYLRSMAIRNFVDGIAAKSYESGEPITLEQADRLIAVALANDPMYRQGKGTDPGKVNWNDVWAPAAKFLLPEQLVTFETAVEVWSLQKRISLGLKSAAPSQR